MSQCFIAVCVRVCVCVCVHARSDLSHGGQWQVATRPSGHPPHQGSVPHPPGRAAEEHTQVPLQPHGHTPGRLEGSLSRVCVCVFERERVRKVEILSIIDIEVIKCLSFAIYSC